MFLHDMGAKRVVLARELSLDEIADIRAKTPKELELEAFCAWLDVRFFFGKMSYFKLYDRP